VVAATCATPAAVAAMFGSLYLLQAGWFAGKTWETAADTIRLYAAFSAPIAFFAIIAAGAPMAHRLKHLGHRGFLHHALVGVVLGAAPFALFDGYIIGTNLLLDVRPAPDWDTFLTAVHWAGLGAWCGLWSAITYWLTVIRERRAPHSPNS